MKWITLAQLVGVVSAANMLPKELNVDSPKSIRNVAATIAHDAMSFYNGNTSSNPTVSSYGLPGWFSAF